MFTGIVEEVGSIASIRKGKGSSVLQIKGDIIFSDMHIGDSIAVNGVCLTVTSFANKTFTCDVMETTLAYSSIGSLGVGSPLNLERAMAANGRFGGHIVTGHIDGTGKISNITKGDNSHTYTITTTPGVLKYIIHKGSIAIDGISLTITNVDTNSFSVGIIPHTSLATTLSTKGVGSIVNLENDVIGKYVERLLAFNNNDNSINQSNLSQDFLTKHGFV